MHGGIKRGTRYSQQIRIGAQFDLSKLLDSPDAGRVQLLVNDRRGHSATEDLLGNRLSSQENYGGEYTRLTEFSYQRNLFSPDLSTKLGFMVMGTDFGGMPISPGVRIVVASPNFPENAYRGRKETVRVVLFI